MAESIEKELSIMFASVAGTSKIHEAHGDEQAHEITNRCVNIIKDIITKYNGRFVKTIGGNKVMAVFNLCAEAGNASIDMQTAVSEIPPAQAYGSELSLSIGFHFGNVLENTDDGDVFGDAVNVAARISGLANAGHTMISGEFFAKLPKNLQVDTMFSERTAVKGRQEPLDIYELFWQEECDATVAVTMIGQPGQIKRFVLDLVYAGKTFDVSDVKPKLTIGRASDSDLILNQSLASRNHAVVQYNQGKFILSDKSTNGTTIIADNGRSIHIVKEDFELSGTGYITAGKSDGDTSSMVAFKIYEK